MLKRRACQLSVRLVFSVRCQIYLYTPVQSCMYAYVYVINNSGKFKSYLIYCCLCKNEKCLVNIYRLYWNSYTKQQWRLIGSVLRKKHTWLYAFWFKKKTSSQLKEQAEKLRNEFYLFSLEVHTGKDVTILNRLLCSEDRLVWLEVNLNVNPVPSQSMEKKIDK